MEDYRVTTDEPAPSKAELLEALHAGRDEVVALVRGLPPERLEHGRHENGWNGRQILAHIASIEWSYPRLIEVAKAAKGLGPDREFRAGLDIVMAGLAAQRPK